MQFTTIVAAFFLDGESAPGLAELVERAGMTNVRPLSENDRLALGFHEPDREVLAGQWGAFGDTWAILDKVDGYVCLQLYSSMNDFYSGEEMTYAATFRDTCLALKPVIAFLDTRSHYGDERWQNKQGNRDWVLSFAPLVLAADANALADERFSMLYIGPELADLWTPDPYRDDRDEVEVPAGRLVYARRGEYRMA